MGVNPCKGFSLSWHMVSVEQLFAVIISKQLSIKKSHTFCRNKPTSDTGSAKFVATQETFSTSLLDFYSAVDITFT